MTQSFDADGSPFRVEQSPRRAKREDIPRPVLFHGSRMLATGAAHCNGGARGPQRAQIEHEWMGQPVRWGNGDAIPIGPDHGVRAQPTEARVQRASGAITHSEFGA
jgi:hypothetical protein